MTNDNKTSRYYDELLVDHERRYDEGLTPNAEYKRLSALADACLAEDDNRPVPNEVMDFLAAIDRAMPRIQRENRAIWLARKLPPN